MMEKGETMIELRAEQREELNGTEPAHARDPETNETYILVKADVYERMKELLYDDGPWTDDERDALAWEAGKHAGWEDMDEYDNYSKKP
jgi:hypothetical protein